MLAPLKKGVHFIDARHYNEYLIVPTKLKGDVLHKCLGQEYDVKLIKFITGMDMLPD
jgi:hypothetical protein